MKAVADHACAEKMAKKSSKCSRSRLRKITSEKVETRDLLQQLRRAVPELSSTKSKPTQLQIIHSAVSHIQQLEKRVMEHPSAHFLLMKLMEMGRDLILQENAPIAEIPTGSMPKNHHFHSIPTEILIEKSFCSSSADLDAVDFATSCVMLKNSLRDEWKSRWTTSA